MIVRIWRLWLTEFGDALRGHDHANLVAVIHGVWNWTWRPWSYEMGGYDQLSQETSLDTMDMQMCRLWSTECWDILGGHNGVNLEAVIEWLWTYTWWRWLSELWRHCSTVCIDAHGGRDRATVAAVNKRVWSWFEDTTMWTWRLWSTEFRHILGGHDRLSLVMNLVTLIIQTWRLLLREFGDAFGGHDHVMLEGY